MFETYWGLCFDQCDVMAHWVSLYSVLQACEKARGASSATPAGSAAARESSFPALWVWLELAPSYSTCKCCWWFKSDILCEPFSTGMLHTYQIRYWVGAAVAYRYGKACSIPSHLLASRPEAQVLIPGSMLMMSWSSYSTDDLPLFMVGALVCLSA